MKWYSFLGTKVPIDDQNVGDASCNVDFSPLNPFDGVASCEMNQDFPSGVTLADGEKYVAFLYTCIHIVAIIEMCIYLFH